MSKPQPLRRSHLRALVQHRRPRGKGVSAHAVADLRAAGLVKRFHRVDVLTAAGVWRHEAAIREQRSVRGLVRS